MSDFPLCIAAGLKVNYDLTILAPEVEALLANAPVVYGNSQRNQGSGRFVSAFDCVLEGAIDTHTARLLLIEPIVQDSAESLLRELINALNAQSFSKIGVQVIVDDCIERAKALLERGEK